MFKSNQINYILRLGLDMVVLLICFALACLIINQSLAGLFKPPLVVILCTSIMIWYSGARVFLLYGEITLFSYSQEMTVFIRQLLLHLLVLIFIFFLFFQEFYQYRSLVLVYHGLLFVTIPVEKFVFRVIIASIRRQYRYEKRILIVGTGRLGANFYQSRIINNDQKFNLVGVVDDEVQYPFKEKYLGRIAELDGVLHNVAVDEVFIALPSDETEKLDYVIDVCEKQSKRVSLISDFNRFGSGALRVTNYAGFPVVGIRYFPLDDLENRFFKRLFDFVFSACFLLFVYSWLFPIIAIAIKLDSRGPILFKQERWGINNKKIVCYKFRTMYVHAQHEEKLNGFKQAQRNDKRVTRIGKFLRKTSLDEIPQFVNVFFGTMSVVGPRPHPIPLSLESKDLIQDYMLRHLVKPGITGWAQVNGSRGETNLEQMRQRVSFDIWYIEHWSFWLDYQIIFQTLVNMIKGDEKAY